MKCCLEILQHLRDYNKCLDKVMKLLINVPKCYVFSHLNIIHIRLFTIDNSHCIMNGYLIIILFKESKFHYTINKQLHVS